MMGATAKPAPSAAHSVLAALLEARTGQQIASHRAWRLDTELTPLLRARGLETLDELVAQFLSGHDGQVADRIVEALLNGETSFFRDAGTFDLIDQAIGGEGRVRLWSAGCATGQEPLSLAMMFAERPGSSAASMPEIVATDVSESALARARAGRYTQFEVQRGLPVRRLMHWFEGNDAEWTVSADLLRHVSYRRMNLVVDPAPAGQFDMVLCRNVLLYLAAPYKRTVFAKIAAALRPGGFLVLGAGETVIGQTGLFHPSARYRGLYERTAAPVERSRAA
ncbi:CheR family methyltransferase [Sphingomonas rubra]|uniref:Chemotaxis protein methyltransferase CheR n=1 Tax=Sphingomonas rubra TaxID=634430 RepID=A0A1I5SWS9_9SPHN|nr:protein-glutamate O-methyltransferase CheR [Sphingomonas rubra]SFP75210.1 chemotaxis protein methyltransferase CheR [Sphingomonas rubra]